MVRNVLSPKNIENAHLRTMRGFKSPLAIKKNIQEARTR
jgi:hypothetical protein|tara:strand:- start:597 stop:713 length:117 start_codon:yes stop_codon:yes gene_type:complete